MSVPRAARLGLLLGAAVPLFSARAQGADSAPTPIQALPPPPPPPAKTLVRAPGSPPRTTIDEPIGAGLESQYFFLHDDNYFAFQTNGGWPARVKFQISLRFDMLSVGDDQNVGLAVAYTQKSFWDMLDFAHSSPFIESNYHPEAFMTYRPSRFERFREIELGVQHESNGLGEVGTVNQTADSRGWNAVFVDGKWGIWRSWAGRPWLFLTPGLRLWAPFAYDPHALVDAIGYFQVYADVDFRIPEFPQISRISARLKLRRHSFEGDFYYPLLPFISDGRVRAWIFFQVFTGEEERLITYDQSVTHLYAGLGFQ
jgi:outer membrane phospholipase A